MSLLMQALKKAERARQNGLPDEEPAAAADWGLEPLTQGPAAHAPVPADSAPPAVPPGPGGLELSLEPLEPAARSAPAAAPAAAAPSPRAEPRIPLEPAAEAVHDPVPPQARHEPARARAAATPPAAPRAEYKGAEATPRPDAAARAAAAARARAAAGAARPGVDMARLRVAGLSGILLVLLGTFGYVYWRATTAPGPGAALPMVPMPPPSATGATGIVVAPAEPLGGVAAAAPADGVPAAPWAAGQDSTALSASAPATAPATAPAMATAPASAPVATPAGTAPARAERSTRAPVLSGPVVNDDPGIVQAAQQDQAERLERAVREQAADSATGGSGDAAPVAPTYVPPATASSTSFAAGGGDVRIARRSAAGVAPAVQSAYGAFLAGDLAGARQQYEAALRQDPNNRDALLGSAAVAQRESRGAQAAALYARLLELDPQDPDALAALVALRPGDMARSEGKLREILKSRPDAGPVLFALGNLYARQGRWPEAQQAYFRAFTAAPGNPDYAFNLAVGLDRLNQGKLAAGYYERALALPGQAGFDREAVQRRLRELGAASAPLAPAAAPAAVPAQGN